MFNSSQVEDAIAVVDLPQTLLFCSSSAIRTFNLLLSLGSRNAQFCILFGNSFKRQSLYVSLPSKLTLLDFYVDYFTFFIFFVGSIFPLIFSKRPFLGHGVYFRIVWLIAVNQIKNMIKIIPLIESVIKIVWNIEKLIKILNKKAVNEIVPQASNTINIS